MITVQIGWRTPTVGIVTILLGVSIMISTKRIVAPLVRGVSDDPLYPLVNFRVTLLAGKTGCD